MPIGNYKKLRITIKNWDDDDNNKWYKKMWVARLGEDCSSTIIRLGKMTPLGRLGEDVVLQS